ncbi:hypothetical protein OEZ86_012547 [Tetradesmus obliquus]|nr:hypothetical protein OEZ86_012547 [Tetradesmus obliquus]
MAAHNRGCGKGAYTKGNYKNETIKSRVGSTTQALLKPATEVPAWDFPVSAKTYELFFVALCVILVICILEGHQWHQQRACLAAGGVAH